MSRDERSFASISATHASSHSAIVDGVGIRGYLLMRADTPSYHRMKRHYYRMVGTNLFRFSTFESSSDFSNAIFETEVEQVEEWDGKGLFHRYSNAFKLHTSIGTFNVDAESKEDKELWYKYTSNALLACEAAMKDLRKQTRQFSHLLDLSSGGIDSKELKAKPPAFKNHPKCMHPTCNVSFESSRKRQHHCRNCGATICSEHGSQFFTLLHLGFSHAVRVCVQCQRVQRFIQLLRTVVQMYISQRRSSYDPIELSQDEMELRDQIQRNVLDPDYGVSDVLQDLHLHRKSCDPVYTVLVEKLILLCSTNMDDFEFFLPQIFHMWATLDMTTNITKWALLAQVLMTAAKKHVRIAQLIYWHTRAAIDDSCGLGFGQSERSIPPALLKRFPMYKLMLINIEVLVEGPSWKFTPDDDLKASEIQGKMIQSLFNRVCALQDVDAKVNRRRSDTLGNLCTAMMACGIPWAVHSTKDLNGSLSTAFKSQLSEFFRGQLDYTHQLAEVAERLRHVQPVSERKRHLPDELSQLELPKLVFFPLGSCREKLARIINVPVKEGTVFSTKARAPTLIYFEVQRSSVDLDEALWHRQTTTSKFDRPVPHSSKKSGETLPNHDEVSDLLQTALQTAEDNDRQSDAFHWEEGAALLDELSDEKHAQGCACHDIDCGSIDCIINACYQDSHREVMSPRRQHRVRDVERLPLSQLQKICQSMIESLNQHRGSSGIAAPSAPFTSKAATRWLINSAAAMNAAHAIVLGNEMVQAGLIQRVNHEFPFRNDNNLFVVASGKEESKSHLRGPLLRARVKPSQLPPAVPGTGSSSSNTRLINSPMRKPRLISEDEESIRSTGGLTDLSQPSILERFKPEEAMGLLSDLKLYVSEMEQIELQNRIDLKLDELQTQMSIICEHMILRRAQRQQAVENAFGERFDEKIKRIQQTSTYGRLEGWDCVPMIVKSNDDLRQEVFCLQIIRQFQDVFDAAGLNLCLFPYDIVATSASTGFIEVLKNACSLDQLKKRSNYTNLANHFRKTYGGEASPAYNTAMQNFIQSMAGYSLVCYFLQIKDRHNGNIMIDSDGHIIHIDFGFILGIAPGGRFSLETAPFKLTSEMVDAMGGTDSEYFKEYVVLLIQGFLALQQHADTILMMIAIMSHNSMFPCFANKNPRDVLNRVKSLFKLDADQRTIVKHVLHLVHRSQNSYRTRQYDRFQKLTNGILP